MTDDYLTRATGKLDRWQVVFETIKARSTTVAPRQRLEYERQIDLLDTKIALAHELVESLRSSSEPSTQQESKVRLDGVCVEIENAIDSAWAKLG